MAVSFLALVPLPSLRGPNVIVFLALFMFSAIAYSLAITNLPHSKISEVSIWSFAITFRVILMLTAPTISDDVYRFIWDGHLTNVGVNPYAFPVNSERLNIYSTPLRGLVNNSWMASPYLPVAQIIFAVVEFLAPQQVLGFQLSSVVVDLLTGWFIMDILRRLGFPSKRILIYLWNPLVILEFAHSAHIVDAIMILLLMMTFWLLLKEGSKAGFWVPFFLAASTLTKGLPLLIIPNFIRILGKKRMLTYVVIIICICTFTAIGSGWGITGPQDGTGLFGAIRIYLSTWKFNSSIFQWLEGFISDVQISGGQRWNLFGIDAGQITRTVSTGFVGLVCLISTWLSWNYLGSKNNEQSNQILFLLRLACLPTGAYLLFTHTIHPWYAILIIPFLVFLPPKHDENHKYGWFAVPWLYFTLALPFSYLSYIDPSNMKEFAFVRWFEYLPVYSLLILAITINFSKRNLIPDNPICDAHLADQE